VAEKKMRVVAKRGSNKKLESTNESPTPATSIKNEYVEPPVAPDATPIVLTPILPDVTKEETKNPVYIMKCWAGEYRSNSWIGLGWEIFKHRLWHLRKDGRFMD